MQVLVEYRQGSEQNKRTWSSVLVHVHHSPIPTHHVVVYQALGIGVCSRGGVGDKWVKFPMTGS